MKNFLLEQWRLILEYLRFGFLAMFCAAGWLAWKYLLTGRLESGEPRWWELGIVFLATLVINRGTPWWRMARRRTPDDL